MMLIVVSHLLKLFLECAHAGFAVHELKMPALAIVQMCVVQDPARVAS